ncbi:MAG: DUF3299 domain-containing protein [Pirellulaceae bacterium]
MKSIGLCIGLLAIAVAAVLLVAPGSRESKTNLASTDPVVPTLRDPVAPSRSDPVASSFRDPVASSLRDPVASSLRDGVLPEQEAAKLARAPAEVDSGQTDSIEPKDEVDDTSTTATQPVDPRTKGVVIKKSSAAARAKGEITFDDLQFDIEKDAQFSNEMLDDDVKSLDGLDVRLNGYILPTTLFKETGIDQFVLVRDNQECCFGPGAALFDCVIVEMQDGNTTDFVTRPVTVYGKLKIDTDKYKYPGGKGPRGTTHFAIFRLEGQKVK